MLDHYKKSLLEIPRTTWEDFSLFCARTLTQLLSNFNRLRKIQKLRLLKKTSQFCFAINFPLQNTPINCRHYAVCLINCVTDLLHNKDINCPKVKELKKKKKITHY